MNNLPIRGISGIRGIINKTIIPLEIYKTVTAFYKKYLSKKNKRQIKIILGKDAKKSGNILVKAAIYTLREISKENKIKIKQVFIGTTSTPILVWLIKDLKADAGIMITASHNPIEYNGIKLFSGYKENATSLKPEILNKIYKYLSEKLDNKYKKLDIKNIKFIPQKNLQVLKKINKKLIKEITKTVDKCYGKNGFCKKLIEEIKRKKIKVIIDACSKDGAKIPVNFLKEIGISDIKIINNKSIENCGRKLEPSYKNLENLKQAINKYKGDIGFAFDPDQDRLVCLPLKSEEYTPLLAAKFLFELQKHNQKKYIKNIAVNLSSTSAWDDVCKKYGIKILRTPVGEINVVKTMIENSIIFGAEGNGGIIFSPVTYCRNSIVGMFLLLLYSVWKNKNIKELEKEIPQYYLTKKKLKLKNSNKTLRSIKNYIEKNKKILYIDKRDGYKVFFKDSWVQIRNSNTEPIIRIFIEKKKRYNKDINNFVKKIEYIIKSS